MVFLGTVNKFLGALFGLIKISLILSLIVIILDQFVFLFDFMEKNVIKDSFLFDHLKSFGIQIISWFSKNKDILPNEGYDLL
jgi:membrane protein required for colicin V production